MLTIKAEGYAGQSISEVAKDMVYLARRMDVCVEVNFNGSIICAISSDEPQDVVINYERERRRLDARRVSCV